MPKAKIVGAKTEMANLAAGGDSALKGKRGRSKEKPEPENVVTEKEKKGRTKIPKEQEIDSTVEEENQKKGANKLASSKANKEQDVAERRTSPRLRQVYNKEENTEDDGNKVTKTKKKDETNGVTPKTPREKLAGPSTDEPKPKDKKKVDKEEGDKPGPSNSTTTKWDSINFTCKKKNGKSQKANLKISCWNIGGLKSWLKKDCVKFLQYEDPDIFCVQKTKCSEDNLPEEIKKLEGYEKFWCARKKEVYAGVGLFTKKKPLSVTYGINNEELGEDGRCITAEFDEYYVVCVYVPNAGRKLVTLPKRLKWNEVFKDYITSLDEKKPVIIAGDMNVAHSEIDLARPANNTKNAGFTQEERDGMTDFLEDGYVDTFRKLYPEKTDAYTFWTYTANARAKNIGWRVDYFIVSERIMDKVCDHVIRKDILGSDHCPITLFVNI